MEEQQKLGKVWAGVYSSSIENWHDKLDKRLNLPLEFDAFNNMIFVGMYHWLDYARFFWHSFFPVYRKVFWCGGDILNLSKTTVAQFLFRNMFNIVSTEHFCENEVERKKLWSMGLHAKVIPMIFDDPNKYKPCFKPCEIVNIWMCVHEDREEEYGLWYIEKNADMFPKTLFHVFGLNKFKYFENRNVIYHGKLSEEHFDLFIPHYQASIRFNTFDGFSEVTAKSILLGQYPLTAIEYPNIDSFVDEQDIEEFIEKVRKQTKSNSQEAFWRRHLEQSKEKLLA